MYKKACILVAQGVQDEEFIYPYYRLKEDFDLDVIFVTAPKYGNPVGKYGIPFKPDIWLNEHVKSYMEQRKLPYTENESTALIKLTDKYDVVIIPGGWQAPEIMRMNEYVKVFVARIHEQNKIIGAICHGPQVLISANVGRNQKMTAFQGIKDDIANFGAEFVDRPVVVDGNLVTAQHYKDNSEFMKAVLKTYFERLVPEKYQG